ncbi:MAG: IS110 family transposase [Rhodospirillales bacterium]|nr:IS110 family transposase [Rhodospirillales bacterium]
MQVSTIGLDLAKHVFQVHGVDREGNIVLRKRVRRGDVEGFFRGLPPCLIGMEACGTAHHCTRLIRSLGHEVRLLPPTYVKPYVKRGKTDAADAEAICEAVTRPTMRQVPVKSAEQQAALMLHRVRDLLVRQRTMLLNAMRGHMAEFGIVVPQGSRRVGELVALAVGENDAALPALARQALRELAAALAALDGRIEQAEAAILAWHKGSQASRRLAAIPGIGPITASAIVATVGDARQFESARHFAAWLGLVPKQNSTGGKQRQGGISKQGDGYLRRLLVVGATAVIRFARGPAGATPSAVWARALLERRPARLVTVALANKTARIAWAVLTREEVYRKAQLPHGA